MFCHENVIKQQQSNWGNKLLEKTIVHLLGARNVNDKQRLLGKILGALIAHKNCD